MLLSEGSGRLVGLLDCVGEDTTTHPPTASLHRSFDPSQSCVFHSGVPRMTVLLDFLSVTSLGTAKNVPFAIKSFLRFVKVYVNPFNVLIKKIYMHCV